jgi:hypothetical protein
MKIAIKVVTPRGVILGDPGEDLTQEELDQIFKNINTLAYLSVCVNGNETFLPKGLIQESYVVVVKDPRWDAGSFSN